MSVAIGRSGIAASIGTALAGAFIGFLLSVLFMQTTSDADADGSVDSFYSPGRGLEEVEAHVEKEHREDGPGAEEDFEVCIERYVVRTYMVSHFRLQSNTRCVIHLVYLHFCSPHA